jgi:hypothetical protein
MFTIKIVNEMKNIILKIGSMILVVSILTSCLDDNFVDFSKVANVVELFDAVGAGTDVVQAPVSASATPVPLDVRINVTGQYPLNKDLNVTLAFDQATFDKYLAANPTSRALVLPSNAYTMGSKVLVKANERVGKFQVMINTSLVDLTKNLILPLKITDAEGQIISGNFGAILLHVTVKNQFDGAYKSTGTRFNFATSGDFAGWDAAAKVATGTLVSTVPFTLNPTTVGTINETTSWVHVGNLDATSGCSCGLGTFNITTNPDNSVTIASSADTGVPSFVALPGVPSSYNPATKTFDLYYQWTNASGTFRVVHDVLVKQ